MSNIPLYMGLMGVIALIYGIIKDTMFDAAAILIAILGIIVGVLITYLVLGEPK